MSAQVYPGKGLSTFQLAFALNEELKRTAYASSFTFEQVSQLDHLASIALATIREWRNSFIPINRVPLDILSLIPTHLVDQKDRFHASFVCRHWRKTLLQRAELWSQLLLSKGDIYTKTLLGRAKGSALDVVLDLSLPISRMALVSPRAGQIKSLSLSGYGWEKVQKFLEVVSGPLPLLRTLKLFSFVEDRPNHLDVGTPPCPTFFDSAVNLRTFYYHSSSSRSQYLRCFLFPNITSFNFSAETLDKPPVLQLLDFLEASPMLQTVRMRIIGGMLFDGIPQGRVVVLSRVETFSLCISEGGPDYRLATHISCPSAKRTSLTHEGDVDSVVPEEVFPGPVVWKTIVHQYTTSPAEEVTLEMNKFTDVACKLTFRSPDAAGIDLYIKAKMYEDEEIEEWNRPSVAVHQRVFTEAIGAIRNYRHLAHVKRVRICHDFNSFGFTYIHNIATDVRQLLKSVGPLDELTIYHCEIQPYFYLFLPDYPEDYLEEPIVFPPIKELTVMHQTYLPDGEFTAAIAGFAKSQHARGNPLERVVIICGECMPERMEEELKPWVGGVEYFVGKNCDGPAAIGGSEDKPFVGGYWCACLDTYKNACPHVQ